MRAAAAPDFAIDDGRANGLLGAPVGGIEAGMAQKREQLIAVLGQMLGQSFVGRMTAMPLQQSIQSLFQSASRDGHAVIADLARNAAVAKVESADTTSASPKGSRRLGKMTRPSRTRAMKTPTRTR